MRFIVLVFLLTIKKSEAEIQCLSTNAVTGFATPSQCYQNWCKRVEGGDGRMEYGCDTTGDCAKNADNDPYDPYITEIQNCWGRYGRKTCCCNWSFCNASQKTFFLSSLLLLLLTKIFY